MRILITADLVGGVWCYTTTLARELVDRGHDCSVAVLGDADAERLRELPEGVEAFQRDLRLEWMPGGVVDLEAGAAWLSEVADEWQPDVVHLNQFAYAVGDFPAPVLVVAHSDVLSWFTEVRGERAPDEWSAYAEAVREGLAAADAVAAPTAYQAKRLHRHYGRTGVRVIHNGIRPPASGPSLPPASERPLVLVAGRAWDEAKGIRLLDRALEQLGETAPSVHLVGPMRGPAGERIDVQHLVRHGEVEPATMGRFYANTRLYVGPSLYEPFGLSPLEAAGHGCGLLLSGIGSFRELWSDAAEFFDPLEPGVLAARLSGLLEDPERLDARAEQALRRARDRYTARRMADAYEALYEELTRAAPRSGITSMRPSTPAP